MRRGLLVGQRELELDGLEAQEGCVRAAVGVLSLNGLHVNV